MTCPTVQVKLEVSECLKCPFATNSSRDRDVVLGVVIAIADVLTAAPPTHYWWCKKLRGVNKHISDPREIHVNCPFK